jgi:predicted HTH transcriptional regulator
MIGNELVLSAGIQKRIHTIRGLQVMMDSDLAQLYQVEVKLLNRAVKRNIERFPAEFMFQLTAAEYDSLRYQIGTLNKERGQHRKYLPYAFTEQGVAMLAVLIIEHLKRNKSGSARDFRDIFPGLSRFVISSMLKDLKNEGTVECVGKTRGGLWQLKAKTQ